MEQSMRERGRLYPEWVSPLSKWALITASPLVMAWLCMARPVAVSPLAMKRPADAPARGAHPGIPSLGSGQ
eukprot:1552566-Pyramimonas_sp.AAC.1